MHASRASAPRLSHRLIGIPGVAARAGRRRLHQKGSLARWQALRQDRRMTAACAALNNRNNASPPRVGD